VAAFFGLWFWPGWHYRFRWLLVAYVAMVGAFTTMLLAGNLGTLITAELFFGGALGLIYYSSLFYSMDVGETKGEHGGIHEAAIGFGNFAGPALGAASLRFFAPASQVDGGTNLGIYAVCGLLFVGFGALLTLWRTGKSNS
jgi:hypothetical protein